MSIVIEKAGGKFDLGTVRVVAADAAAETAAVDTGVEVWLAREAAEAAIGLGKNDPDFADTGPVSFFLAESCSLVFTTKKVPQSFQLHSAFFFWQDYHLKRALTPNRICPGTCHDTSNDCCTQVNDRTILCRLSWFLSRCIRKLFGKVDFGGWIKVKVDCSKYVTTVVSTFLRQTECVFKTRNVPSRDNTDQARP